jgi:cytochrome c peroxidase
MENINGKMMRMVALSLVFLVSLSSAQIAPPPALNTVEVPEPPNLADYVLDKQKAIELGKALFWDMSLGSDGDQACASCHFNAGADSRSKNSLHPGPDQFDFAGPNAQLMATHMPLVEFSDPFNRLTAKTRDYNEVLGSGGISLREFKYTRTGDEVDKSRDLDDPVFSAPDSRGRYWNTRRVTGRNTPSVINAAFNIRNFWDGRASHLFNGASPFGQFDPEASIYMMDAGGNMVPQQVIIEKGGLASQAVGPVLSDVEMAFAGRAWRDVGKKIFSLRPLKQQWVHPDDSVLGHLANSQIDVNAEGLMVSYAQMVREAFRPEFWADSTQYLEVRGGVATVNDWPLDDGAPKKLRRYQFSQMELNFSLFFGLAIQLYEATLISDNSKYDQFARNETVLTPQEQRGMDIFFNIGLNPDPTIPAGFCAACHTGSEFTSATWSQLGRVPPTLPGELPALPEGLIERMPTGFGAGAASISMSTAPTIEQQSFPAGFEFNDLLATVDVVPSVTQAPAGVGSFSGSLPAGTNLSTALLTVQFLEPEPLAGTDPFVEISLSVDLLGDKTFDVVGGNLPVGFYDVHVNGKLFGTIQSVQDAIYDVGFYNVGVRNPSDDLGLGGGTHPDGTPLSINRQIQSGMDLAVVTKGLPGGGFLPVPATIAGEHVIADGAFKTPTLRNIELTAPYFHNGGKSTLREAVEFYNRGSDFHDENQADLSPEIMALGMTSTDIDDVVAFLKTLTDERVRMEQAPFDHPEIYISNGHRGDESRVWGKKRVAMSEYVRLDATGSTGGAGLTTFLDPAWLAKAPVMFYRDDDGNFVLEKDLVFSEEIPLAYALHENYPNPFNPTTTITYDLAEPTNVRMVVYDLLGREIATLVNAFQPAGVFNAQWDGRNSAGQQVSSGMYILALKTDHFNASRKMILAK